MTPEWSAKQVLDVHDREHRALRELIVAQIRRLDEELETQVVRWQEARASDRDLLASMAEERTRAIEKFEATVAARFVQQNEFRDSLDDLGKQMATRRELEVLTESISNLRSRADAGAGAQQRSSQLSATAVAWAGVALVAISIAVGLLVRFA